jgi:hypothetical protein
MAKGKKKASQPKQKKKNGTNNRRRAVRPVAQPRDNNLGRILHAANDICSVTNPFCPQAIGSRWPDNSYTKSVPWAIKGVPVSITSNANGNGSRLFLPCLRAQTAEGTIAFGADDADYSTATFSAIVTEPSGVSRWRMTSWGVVLQCPLAPMTATGTCHIRLASPESGASLTNFYYLSTMNDASMDIPLARLIGHDVHIIPMPLGVEPRMFRSRGGEFPTPTDITTFANPGWQVINIAVTGAPTSNTVLTAYAYYHFELVFDESISSNAFAIAPPANNPLIRNGNAGVLERVGNFIEGTAKKVDSFFTSTAAKFLLTGADYLTGGKVSVARGAAGLLTNGAINVD